LPLTANGKTDRKALPALEGRALDSATEFVAPADPIEQNLARLWCRLLRVPRVGANDNFFELGGHSLLAVRIMAEIEKFYARRLPLATLFQFPTVAGLASVLRTNRSDTGWSSLVPIRPEGSRSPLFLIHSHGGNVLEYYPLAARLDPDQPVYALQARGLDGNIVVNQSIEQIAAAYLAEIRSLQPSGPYFLGGFCFGGLVAWEAAQQLTAAGETVSLLAMIQTVNPGLHETGRRRPASTDLLRTAVHRLGVETEHLRNDGIGRVRERIIHFRDVIKARSELGSLESSGEKQTNYVGRPVPVILEALGREHDAAFEAYVPKPYAGKTVLLRGDKQVHWLRNEDSLGWSELASDLTICAVSGYQQTMLREPNVASTAAHLDLALQESRLGRERTSVDDATAPSSARNSQLV